MTVSVLPIPLYKHKFAKIQAGNEPTFCKNTIAIWIKVWALTVKYSIFQKWQVLFFNNAITQFLDWPFDGLSRLFKLELLSSDSFYCQGALKTSFRREIAKRCALRTIAEAIIQAISQKYRRFTGDFLKTPVYTAVPVFIQAGWSHCKLVESIQWTLHRNVLMKQYHLLHWHFQSIIIKTLTWKCPFLAASCKGVSLCIPCMFNQNIDNT